MSTITDKKITDGQRDAVRVQHQPNRLTGTPKQNQKVFDDYAELIREHFNEAMDAIDERISTNDSDIEQLKETDAGAAATSARESAASASESAQATQDMLGRVISIGNKNYTKTWNVTEEQDEFLFTAEGYTYNESDTYEVFVNGLKLSESEYTRNEDSVVLGSSISAGNTVEIIVTTNLKGKGVADTQLNDDYTLTINYDDGTFMTTEPIRGEKGEKGDKGDKGEEYDDTQVKNDIAVLDSRVDSFTHLAEGSTTGDAELIDARIGADGTTYANAGDAVRGQVSGLKNNFSTNQIMLAGSDLASISGSSLDFEKGNVYVYEEKPTFPYSANRIRIKEELFLHAGSVVSVSSTTVRFFLVGRNLISTSWTLNSGWNSANYTVPQDGFYYVVMSYSPESTVSDISALKSYLSIQSTPFGGVFRSVLKDYKYDSGYIAGNGSFSSSSANGEITVSQIPVSAGETYRLYVRYKGDAFAWLAWICYKDGIGLSASNAIGSRASTSDVDISTEAYSFMHIDITVPSQAKTLAFSFRTYGEGEYVLCPYHNESYKESDIEVVYDVALKALNTSSSVDRVINEANVKSINHRGCNSVAPENTIPAFKLSKLKGFNYVETDVQFTSDGVAVLLHDPTINRTARNSDGSELSSTVNIADITYEEALAYDFGIWKSSSYAGTKIPTFEQFLLLCKNIGLSAYVEIKAGNQAQIESLADTVVQYGMKNNVSFIDFYAPRLEFVKDHNQYIRLGLLANSVDASVVSSAANLKTPTNEVFIDASVGSIDASAVSMCISDNIPLEAWTVYANDLPLNPYVTGMTSDVDVLSRKLYIMNI